MLSKIKALPALATIVSYLQSTSSSRKVGDFAFVAILLSLIGIVTGKLPIPYQWPLIDSVWYVGIASFLVLIYLISNKYIEIKLPKKHTVEDTCKVSEEVSRILSGEQYAHGFNFIGHFRFHNGMSGVDGIFNFMKFSLTEYANAISVNVDPMRFQNLPIIINMKLVSSLIDGRGFAGQVSQNSTMYLQLARMGVKSYSAYPVKSKQGLLCGFVYVGSNSEQTPTLEHLKDIAEKIQLVGK